MEEKKKNTPPILIVCLVLLCVAMLLVGWWLGNKFYDWDNSEDTTPKVDISTFVSEIDKDNIFGRTELEEMLTIEGYTEDEINNVIQTIDIDWSKKASDYVKYKTGGYEKYTRGEINHYLKGQKFTAEEISLSTADITKADLKENALEFIKSDGFEYYSKKKLEEALKEEEFTDNEIKYALDNLNANYYDRAMDLIGLLHLSIKKSQVKNYLLEKGFTESEASINLPFLYELYYSVSTLGGTYGKYKNNNVSSYNVGDSFRIGGEDFDVIKSDANKTILLAKKGLYVDTQYQEEYGYNTQNLTAYDYSPDPGDIRFAQNSYWTNKKGKLLEKYGTSYPAYVYDSNNNTYKYIEKYVSLLKNLEIFSSIEGRLISYEELTDLGCKYLTNDCPYFISSPEMYTFLTGSVESKNYVYTTWGQELTSNGNIKTEDLHYIAVAGKVRPVIVVKTSDLKNNMIEDITAKSYH